MTTTVPSELSVQIRAWPTSQPEQENLQYLIARINDQKKSFRNVSEDELKREIEAHGTTELPDSNEEEVSDDEAEPKSRKEELLEAKKQLIQAVGQAQTDSSYALDFVSLLLSKHSPRQAETTISPFLKQNVPLGSIGAEVGQIPSVPETRRHEEELTCIGWKLQSLNASADSLLRSATRLEKEMEDEAQYWKKALAVKEKGWAIMRLSRERHTLGVRFGFSEAAPEFRERGLGALRRAEDGSVFLDLGPGSKNRGTLQVCIKEQGRALPIASSLAHVEDDMRDDSLEASILRARNSIFDEELYHELTREARQLTNRGVRCTSDAIVVPLEKDKSIVIDLHSPATHKHQDLAERDLFYDSLSTAIGLACQILLSHAHRLNFKRRTRPQPPLTLKPPSRQVYFILRPLLALLEQQSALSRVAKLLAGLETALESAGLTLTVESPKGLLDFQALLEIQKTANAPLVEVFASGISAPLQTQCTLALPSTSASVRVRIYNHLQGTEYKVTIDASPNSSLSGLQQDSTFTSADAVEEHIMHLIMLDLISLVAAEDEKWQPLSPNEGQLSTDPDLSGRYQVLTLSVKRDGLEMICRGTDEREVFEKKFVWNGDVPSERGLLETVRGLGAL